jgi:hypothetical protein
MFLYHRVKSQEKEEEVEGTIDFEHDDYGLYNDFVSSGNRYSKEHDSNTEFQAHVRQHVDRFTSLRPLYWLSERMCLTQRIILPSTL